MNNTWTAVLSGLLLGLLIILPEPARALECDPLGQTTPATDGAEKPVLRVAIRSAPPFLMRDEIAGCEGIAFELWRRIADRLGVATEFVRVDNVRTTLKMLETRQIDLAISPLTITAKREETVDFSHQYFRSGLAVAALRASDMDLFHAYRTVAKTLTSDRFVPILAIFLAVNALFLLLIFRRLKASENEAYDHDPAIKGEPWHRRLAHFSLFSLLITTGMSRDVFAFRSVLMQFVSFLIVLFGITVTASFFGVITAALTQSLQIQKSYQRSDLADLRVVTLANSTAEEFLRSIGHICQLPSTTRGTAPVDKGGRCTAELTIEWALQDVLDGHADVVLADWVQLSYLVRQAPFNDALVVQNDLFKFEPYGWGFPPGSPWREPVNRELVRILRSDAWKTRLKIYLGTGPTSPN